MIDATTLYPKGFHPIWQSALPSGKGLAKPLRRIDVPSVRYHIIDFGISSRFEDSSLPRLVTGTNAQDREIPELSDSTPYDLFAVDVFTLGNLYKRNLLNVRHWSSFLSISYINEIYSCLCLHWYRNIQIYRF